MQAFIGFSALLLMPLYAAAFIGSFAHVLQCIKKEEPIAGPATLASISFALMMWTLSGTLLLAAE